MSWTLNAVINAFLFSNNAGEMASLGEFYVKLPQKDNYSSVDIFDFGHSVAKVKKQLVEDERLTVGASDIDFYLVHMEGTEPTSVEEANATEGPALKYNKTLGDCGIGDKSYVVATFRPAPTSGNSLQTGKN